MLLLSRNNEENRVYGHLDSIIPVLLFLGPSFLIYQPIIFFALVLKSPSLTLFPA